MIEAKAKNKIDDRRTFSRFPSRFPAKFKDTRDDFGRTVMLRDASAEGARIVSKERLFLHDSIALEVDLPDGHQPMLLRGEVVWLNKDESEYWDIGLKFHKIELLRLSRLYKFAVDFDIQ